MAAEQHPQARTVLQRRIAATDREIDALVYALYELNDPEIRIVEPRRRGGMMAEARYAGDN
jgi:hypothetical protein